MATSVKRETSSKITVAKKAVTNKATPSLQVRGHASKILRSLDEAEQIHTGKKEGASFDDFLANF